MMPATLDITDNDVEIDDVPAEAQINEEGLEDNLCAGWQGYIASELSYLKQREV